MSARRIRHMRQMRSLHNNHSIRCDATHRSAGVDVLFWSSIIANAGNHSKTLVNCLSHNEYCHGPLGRLHSPQCADGFAKMKSKLLIPGLAVVAAVGSMNAMMAAERPTLNHHTHDPRPDILPHPLWDAHVEHRRAYNRPTYIGGWLAFKISRTSQEAMVWQENLLAGNYDRKHVPPMYKRFYAPKPWEVLATGPRPDFPEQKDVPPPAAMNAAIEAKPLMNLADNAEVSQAAPTQRELSDRSSRRTR